MLGEAVAQLGAGGLARPCCARGARRWTRSRCSSPPTATRATSAAARRRSGCRRSPRRRSPAARATRPRCTPSAPRATSARRQRAIAPARARCTPARRASSSFRARLTRATADGIDAYAHTIAYNGLALFGLNAALDALAPIAAVADRPAGGRRAPERAGRARDRARRARRAAASGSPSTRRRRTRATCARTSAGSRSSAAPRSGWVDLLAPRPLTQVTPDSGGPALMHLGRPIRPTGFGAPRARRRGSASTPATS